MKLQFLLVCFLFQTFAPTTVWFFLLSNFSILFHCIVVIQRLLQIVISQSIMSKDNKEYTSWDKKGPIAKQLVEQFDLFNQTNGAAGIDPTFTKPKTIREKVRKANDFLHPINPQYFAKHYLSTVHNWRLNKQLERARKGEWWAEVMNKIYIFISSLYTHFFSFVQAHSW